MTPPAGALLLATAIGAGLATGLARFPDPPTVTLATLAALAYLRRPAPAIVGVAFVLGVLGGTAMRHDAATSCAQRLPLGERTFRLRLIDPGLGTGRAIPLEVPCAGSVRVRWPADSVLAAGQVVVVRGRWQPRPGALGRPGGTLAAWRILASGGNPSWLARSRTAVALAIEALFGERAGLVHALVAGQGGAIPPDVRDRFAAAGLVHVLSISGFHMGLIAFWSVLLLRSLTLPLRHAELAAAVVVIGYTAWLGWPPPATRAMALCVAVVVSRRRQRAPRADGLLGASALVVLAIDPWSVADLGAWLSFAAMAGVLWACAWYRRVTEPHPIGEAVAGSIGATLATAPIAALTLGRVAAIGPVVNLVGLPVAAILVPVLLAAVALQLAWPPLAAGFAATGTLLLVLLDRVAAVGAGLPGAAGAAVAGPGAALPWIAFLLLAILATRGDATPREALRRTGWGAVAMLWWPVLVSPVDAPQGALGLALHFLDVGQGDAALVRTPGGAWVAIDLGPADGRHDAGARVVAPFLRRHGAAAVAIAVISHAHRDHVGGGTAVAASLPIAAALDPGEPFADSSYLSWLGALGDRGVRWFPARAGMQWRLDGVEFEVLHPPASWPGRGRDLNDDSLVLLVRFGAFSALFTGDAGVTAEALWLARVGPLDLLKVGHHGSAGSTGDALLAATRPRVAVVSSGRNRYGHPAPATLGRLAARGVATWRTDREGTVSVETDGRTFRVRGGRTSARFDARDPLPETVPCCIPPR